MHARKWNSKHPLTDSPLILSCLFFVSLFCLLVGKPPFSSAGLVLSSAQQLVMALHPAKGSSCKKSLSFACSVFAWKPNNHQKPDAYVPQEWTSRLGSTSNVAILKMENKKHNVVTAKKVFTSQKLFNIYHCCSFPIFFCPSSPHPSNLRRTKTTTPPPIIFFSTSMYEGGVAGDSESLSGPHARSPRPLCHAFFAPGWAKSRDQNSHPAKNSLLHCHPRKEGIIKEFLGKMSYYQRDWIWRRKNSLWVTLTISTLSQNNPRNRIVEKRK